MNKQSAYARLLDELVDEGLDEDRAEELALEIARGTWESAVDDLLEQGYVLAPGREASIAIGRALRPGIVEATVGNGHATAIQRWPWQYRNRPGDLIRELGYVSPELVEAAFLALPQAHEEAAAVDATPLEIKMIAPDEIETFLDGLPPNLLIPNFFGLTLPRDWTAPTLIYGPSGVGKSWLVAGILSALATVGVRSLVLATEGGWEWANRLQRYPIEQRPWLFPDTPDREAIDRLVPTVNDNGIDLIVVDVLRPLFRRLDVSENDSEAIDSILVHLEPLRAEGRALLLVHHEGKDGALGPRGSSALADQAGAVFQLEPDEDGPLAIVNPRKWRSGPLDSQPTLSLAFTEGGHVTAHPYEPPDSAEERTHAIVGALTRIGEPTTIGALNAQLHGIPGGKVTGLELSRLADEGIVHSHVRERHPLWLPVPATAECCQS